MSCRCGNGYNNGNGNQPQMVQSGAYQAFNVGTGAAGSQAMGGCPPGYVMLPNGRCAATNLSAGYGAAPTPGCSLTAPSPPSACCNPAPLHCSSCNGSGFFLLSEAYGS